MSVAFSTAIIPQPMQVRAGSAEIGDQHQCCDQNVFTYSDGSNHVTNDTPNNTPKKVTEGLKVTE
jgi:hypothetical protein